jgi:nitrate reductase NapA
VKGYHVGLALYGKDRLTTPLLRKGGRMVPIGWEEAIDVVARRIMANPKGFSFHGSGQWTIPEGYAANKFVKAGLGTNLIDANPRLCMASAVTGFLSTFGVDEPPGVYDDLDACDVAIVWGNNMAEMHPVLFSRLVDRRTRGEKVVIIDLTTRRTRTSELADEVIFLKPHGDLAIANGIAHLLVRDGTWDKGFVEAHCNFRRLATPTDGSQPGMLGEAMTFEEFAKAVYEYTPERVEELSGVSAAKMRMLGELFGRRDIRINSLWCMGMNQHTRGTAVNCLVHGIHLPSGHFGRPGDRDEPDGAAVRLRHGPRSRHAVPSPSWRPLRRQARRSREGGGDLERRGGADRSHDRLPRGRAPQALQHADRRGRRHHDDLGTGDESRSDDAEPLAG